jgi:uncharacterized 2Fe-2S/4Fe-4S cluster protein (DUF4445 family)
MTDQGRTPRFRVDFEPVGRRAEVRAGETLLDAAQTAGVELESICGGAGSCGGCRVRLMAGELTPATASEEEALGPQDLSAGYRLACQAVPRSDVKLDVPPESLATVQRLQIEGIGVETALDPLVVTVDVQVDPPTLQDLRADCTRLEAALHLERGALRVGLPLLTVLSGQLRAQEWSARLALRQREVIAVVSRGARLFGLAVDIGTTKLAAYLVDLVSGETVARTGAMNPQIAYGEDVVSRIQYGKEHAEGRQVLQGKLVATLNELLAGLCGEAGASPEQVVEAVVVGNTAMHHLFAGLPVEQLGRAPYVPVVSEALDLRADEVGLALAPGAHVYLPPNIAGYVGADHVAMVLASAVGETERTTLALDIGTNTEICLAHRGRMLSCSCASGPAFEGAHIHDGMRAAPGAIERVQIVGEAVNIHTIGNQPPVGICGSGILDAVAEMLRVGVLDRRGCLQEGGPHVRVEDGRAEFVLAPAATAGHGRDVVVTRRDVSEIQLAKAAIRAGVEVLLAQAGISAGDIESFIVAGAFGTYLDVRSAVAIGMFPALPPERFRQVGNAAGIGARQMLVSAERRRAADALAQRIEYVELTTYRDFTAVFVKAMYLG